MLELATWGKLSYFMLTNEDPSNHLILVEDSNGKRGTFQLETAKLISSNLSPEDNVNARRMIHDMRVDFLEYWREYQQKSAIN